CSVVWRGARSAFGPSNGVGLDYAASRRGAGQPAAAYSVPRAALPIQEGAVILGSVDVGEVRRVLVIEPHDLQLAQHVSRLEAPRAERVRNRARGAPP